MGFSLLPLRLAGSVLGVCVTFALLLGTIGIYGITSYAVTQRLREIGIRIALGAQARNVTALFVKQGIRLGLIGVMLGVGGALPLSGLLRKLLLGIQPTDPLTFAAVPLLLISVSVLACWLPARHAAKVDPVEALRCE